MTLKKYSFFIYFFILGSMIVSRPATSQVSTPKSSNLPNLHYIGIIPVQWEKDEVWQDLEKIKSSINQDFIESMKSSKRFALINSELVRSLWKNPSGRKELETDYELNAYGSLDIAARGDMVVLTARILSPKFDTWLQESDVVSRRQLSESTHEQIQSKLTDLVLRMINRLPVDANITSVNGSYVTIAGGIDQGIKTGSKFDVVAPTIESLHPANGSWISFGTSKTGTIEVIESKPQSSIAKITSLTFENSIKPGNGIYIADIMSRSRFARTEEKNGMQNAGDNSNGMNSAIVEPVKVGSAPKSSQNSNNSRQQELSANPPTKSEGKTEASQDLPSKDAEPKQETADSKKTEGPTTDSFAAKLMPKGSELRTWLGLKMWSIGGSSTASASLPLWIINSGGADVYRKYSETIDYNYGIDLGYGPTGQGSFFGYNFHAGGRWHLYQKDILPGADDVYFGLLPSFSSTSITGEDSGGYDLTQIRLNIGIHGWAKPDFIGDKVEWTGEIFYPLYSSGQFGVKGGYKSIGSGSSLAFRLGGYLGDRPADGWQYGGAFDYENSSWSLQEGQSASVSSIGLLILARRNL